MATATEEREAIEQEDTEQTTPEEAGADAAESTDAAPTETPIDAAPAVAANVSPEQYHLGLIRDAEAACDRAECSLADAVMRHKVTKKLYETKVAELRELIRRGPERLPLFDGQAAPTPTADPDVTDETDESWRTINLAEALLSVSSSTLRWLADAGLMTVGDLADYTAGGKLLTDIDGIGAAKAEKIEAAMDSFWAEYRLRQDKNETTAGDSDDDGKLLDDDNV